MSSTRDDIGSEYLISEEVRTYVGSGTTTTLRYVRIYSTGNEIYYMSTMMVQKLLTSFEKLIMKVFGLKTVC